MIVRRSNDKREVENVIDNISSKIIELFSSRIEPYILTISELKKKSKLPIIAKINKTGKLLCGKSLLAIL